MSEEIKEKEEGVENEPDPKEPLASGDEEKEKLAKENEKLKEQINKAGYTIQTLREDLKNRGVINTEAIAEVVKSEVDRFKVEMQGEAIEVEILKASNDPEEQKTIREIYQNKINKSGFTREEIATDVALAKLIANKSRIEKNIEEIKTAADSSQKKSGGTTSGQGAPESKKEFTNNEEEEIERIMRITGESREKVLKYYKK